MTLNWTDNAATETGYLIFRSLDGTNYTQVATLAASAVTYPATGIELQYTYHWQVYAVNEGSSSSALSGSQATLTGAIGGTKNIPVDYATLALAIDSLNLQGVAPGGVTLNLLAGNPQTAPVGGIVLQQAVLPATKSLFRVMVI